MAGMTDAQRAALIKATKSDKIEQILVDLLLDTDDEGIIDFDGPRAALALSTPNKEISGDKDIALVVTPEALGAASGKDVRYVDVIAKSTNTGALVYIGDVSAQQWPVRKEGVGDPQRFLVEDIDDLYVRVTVNGDGVFFKYGYRE